MAVRSVPLWIAAGCYTDVDLRAYFSVIGGACAAGGVRRIAGGEMLVTAAGGMNVAVAVGTAWIPGTDAAGQGSYLVDNPTSTTLTVTTANPTNPRIDRVVADVNDPAFTGSGSAVFTLAIIAGTPAGSPVAPATPPSAISLATIAVAAGAASIVAGNITDTRPFCDPQTEDFVGVKLRRVASLSLPNNTQTSVPWDTEDFDPFGFITATSVTITIPAGLGGMYLANYEYTGFQSSSRLVEVNHNAARLIVPVPPSNSLTGLSTWGPRAMAAGDTLVVKDLQTSGSTQTMTGALILQRIGAS